MPTGRITKRSVDAVASGKTNAFLWDDEVRGFGIKVTPTGARTYLFQYRMGGRGNPTRRWTIGPHGDALPPDQAREIAKGLRRQVEHGIDPIEADRDRKQQAKQLKAAAAKAEQLEHQRGTIMAVRAVGKRFLVDYAKRRRGSTCAFAESTMRLHVYPAIGDMPLPDLTRRNVREMLDRLSVDHPALRRNVFAVFSSMITWALENDEIDQSPIAGMKPPQAVASRDRVLSDGELAIAWRAAVALPYPFGPLFQLLFATGQRREEVAGLAWAELDRNQATWTLPAERAKNGEAHLVPLNSLAMVILDEAAGVTNNEKKHWPRRGLVFTTNGKTHVSGYSKAKACLDAKMLELVRKNEEAAGAEFARVELAPWRIHDARRTLATGLQRLGVRFEVTEAVLNHVSGARSGVAGVYQRYGWADEKRAALDAWAVHLLGLITPADRSNVVPLNARA